MLAMIRRGLGCDGVGWGFDVTLSPMAADHVRPTVAIPLDLLDRSLSAERAPAAHTMSRLVLVPPGPAAQRSVIPFAARRIHERPMPLFLQVGAGGIEVGEERIARHAFE